MKKARSAKEARILELVDAGFKKWKNGTGSIFELLAPEARWTVVGSSAIARTYTSKREFMESVVAPLSARLRKPLVPDLRALFVDDDTAIVLFDASGVAMDGKPYQNSYSWYMRFNAEQIVDVTAFSDSIAFNDLWFRVNPA